MLPPDDAARLLLSTAGADAAPPYSAAVYAAVEACGRLPLTLAVAGGILQVLQDAIDCVRLFARFLERRLGCEPPRLTRAAPGLVLP